MSAALVLLLLLPGLLLLLLLLNAQRRDRGRGHHGRRRHGEMLIDSYWGHAASHQLLLHKLHWISETVIDRVNDTNSVVSVVRN